MLVLSVAQHMLAVDSQKWKYLQPWEFLLELKKSCRAWSQALHFALGRRPGVAVQVPASVLKDPVDPVAVHPVCCVTAVSKDYQLFSIVCVTALSPEKLSQSDDVHSTHAVSYCAKPKVLSTCTLTFSHCLG